VRLSSEPLRLFDRLDDVDGRPIGTAIIGGPRATPYLCDVSRPVRSLGAQLRPGAAELLFGVGAHELSERHTALEDLWGRRANELRDRLLEAQHLERQIELFEALLATRLPKVPGLHPAVAHALVRFSVTDDVRNVVEETGYSHRHLIAMFRQSVGLAPKVYCRVLRFQRALDHLAATPAMPLVEVALEVGYSDQPHLNRDFSQLARLSPGQYRRVAPVNKGHVPVRARPARSILSKHHGGTTRYAVSRCHHEGVSDADP
jgi:AraC-like DNA-binding protein